jgi:hypothetical protein
MTRKMRLVTAFALGAGLMAAGVASAQSQTGNAAPPAAPAQPAPARSTSPATQSDTPTFKPSDPDFGQPKYSVNPPPDSPSGLYLPAVVGGYAKSVAGCVVVGCDDGPHVDGAAGPSSTVPAEPPANPAPSDPR